MIIQYGPHNGSIDRSAYSWQLRAALHKTLIDPASAVTFLSYACSGAEIIEGLMFSWKGLERPRRIPDNRAQLAAIYGELCSHQTRIDTGTIPTWEQDTYLPRVNRNAFPWKDKEKGLGDRFAGLLKCGNGGMFTRSIDWLVFTIGGRICPMDSRGHS